MIDDIRILASGGSATLNLNTREFSKISIQKPKYEILLNFNDVVKPLFQTIETNIKQNQALANLRDSLLPKLINNIIKI